MPSVEFLLSQGIVSEDDGTAQRGKTQKKARPSQRRVISAPVAIAQATGALITPSPSPSPNAKKSELMVWLIPTSESAKAQGCRATL